MRLYLIHGLIQTDNSVEKSHKWAGTQADAAKVKAEFVEKGAKRADVKVEDIDVPTDKQGLLAFLNDGNY